MNIALIFGISGQDGSYLARLLLKKKYKVFGATRDSKKKNLINLEKLMIKSKVKIIKLTKINFKNVFNLIKKVKPDEIYFLSGQSSVKQSFEDPINTYVSNTSVLLYILETVRKIKKKIKIYNSSSSECFGNRKEIYCSEKSQFDPISPYGRAKAFSFWLAKYYRDTFNIKTCNGIVFNHESPLRKQHFVTQKIINYAKNYKKNSKKLQLGNINIFRDWGWANDYVDIIHSINVSKFSDDFVVGTGKLHSIKKFIKIVFNSKNIPLNMIESSKKFTRPDELFRVAADTKKIRKIFNWKPKTDFKSIALKMLNNQVY